MSRTQQLRNTYLEQNTQFIIVDTSGNVIESDNVLFFVAVNQQIETIHPFFISLINTITINKELKFSCVHLDLNKKTLICDIKLKKTDGDYLIIISDFSEHYNSFQSLAQSRNETAIDAELLALDNYILHKKEQFKNKFIANFSHEIVSPILSIMTFSNMLNKTSLTKEQKEYLDIIYNSSNLLKSMTNDIFDLSKIETGNLEIINKRFSLKKLIKTIKNEYKVKCNKANLDFYVNYHNDMPTYIVSDKTRIQQILQNLLNNALKFTSTGNISLEIKPIYKRARKITFSIEIKDTGIGIDKQYHDYIFKSFNRLETRKHIHGTGLGLTITKEIIELMKGEITVESTIDQGSVFTITLRTTTPLEKEKQIQQTKTVSSPKEILLVENNYNDQLSIFKILATSKLYFLDIANTGQEALNLVKTKKYDLILMDYKMPDLNGLETAKAINSNLKKQIPILIITGVKIEDSIKNLFNYYYKDILYKPFNEETLIQNIELHLK